MRASPSIFSHPFLVASLPDAGTRVTIMANADERAALAKADGLVSLTRLEGRFDLAPGQAGGVTVRGEVVATIGQTCTVSLDPFESDISEDVDLLFMPARAASAWTSRRKGQAEEEPGIGDDDPPETIVDGRIDLGQITAEFLALGIDPYPRKPGVEFDDGAFAGDKDPSPFAALARLKKEP